jgi:copper transporter 1
MSGHEHHHHLNAEITTVASTTAASVHAGHDAHAGHDSAAGLIDHGAMTHDSMMKMYFHFGLGDTLLFKSFVLNSSLDLWNACAIFFLIAVLYEGLKSLRERLLRRSYASSSSYHVATIDRLMDGGLNDTTSNVGGTGNTSPGESHLVGDASYSAGHHRLRRGCRMFSWPHVIQSSLHVLQVAISYTLMLGFMTFNVCLCFAILVGAGVGYFLFCWHKMSYESATEHCH